MRRILIVDDEKNMRWVLGQALQTEGFEVVEAADGKEALAAVAEQEPDIMVLDHRMPEPDGMEVLRRLRGQGATFPVIMLTAHGNVATAVEAMKAGASEYLTKPFDLEELKLAISKSLEYRELATEVERLREEIQKDYDVQGIVASDSAHARHHSKRCARSRHQRDGDDLRRVGHRQGADRSSRSTTSPTAPPSRSSRCRPGRCPRRCWKASCSATRRARSPVR